jgi:hypothetical protein
MIEQVDENYYLLIKLHPQVGILILIPKIRLKDI